MLITEQTQLDAFVEHARAHKVLAIDTEFMREKTYWPKLCLIQLATPERAVAVDPLRLHDLSALNVLFQDENILKLFHASRQDLEIINIEMGCLPAPIFDTQIAAALLGHTTQIGYGPLVMNELGVHLKKADSYTDWSRRPLTKSQLQYALDDVIYLPKLYDSMSRKLKKLNRMDWLASDFRDLSDPSNYEKPPEERFLHLKRVNQLNQQQLACARNVAAWRERKAMKRNIPRKWVLTDEQLVEICKREPQSIDELFMVRGVDRILKLDDAREVLRECQAAYREDPETWPELPRPAKSERNVDAQVDLMTALVRLRARENNVAFQVLVSHDELVHIARGHYERCDVLKGWRKRMVGDELLKLVNGELALRIEDGNLKVTRRSRSSSRKPKGPDA
ncbi:ribonuclease D [Slackia heliotrinireducens]|uniref:ribonuclease D n=1 Tax=Slackia heliotrinireducens TaxID=84110 RepID=UPI0002EA2689|nr:ribonuclease D [Slackia heliotrinireducens]